MNTLRRVIRRLLRALARLRAPRTPAKRMMAAGKRGPWVRFRFTYWCHRVPAHGDWVQPIRFVYYSTTHDSGYPAEAIQVWSASGRMRLEGAK